MSRAVENSGNVPLYGQSSFGNRLVKSSSHMAATASTHINIPTEYAKSMKKGYSESYLHSDAKCQSSEGERFKAVAAAAQAAVESADRAAAAARATLNLLMGASQGSFHIKALVILALKVCLAVSFQTIRIRTVIMS